jgi:predicted nucleic acid-binding protein
VKRVVLDASALMTFFEDRPGAGKVEELIGHAVEGKTELLMSVVNWGEVYYSVWRARGCEAAQKIMAEIAQLPIEVEDADGELTKQAAELKAQHNLPYADCFAAALARLSKASLATSDRDFVRLKEKLSLVWISAD